MINAFSHIKNDNVKLIVAGNYYFGTNLVNDFEKKIHDMVEKYKEKVIFTGFIPNKEIGAYYSAADITILPSIWEEPAGLTAVSYTHLDVYKRQDIFRNLKEYLFIIQD